MQLWPTPVIFSFKDSNIMAISQIYAPIKDDNGLTLARLEEVEEKTVVSRKSGKQVTLVDLAFRCSGENKVTKVVTLSFLGILTEDSNLSKFLTSSGFEFPEVEENFDEMSFLEEVEAEDRDPHMEHLESLIGSIFKVKLFQEENNSKRYWKIAEDSAVLVKPARKK